MCGIIPFGLDWFKIRMTGRIGEVFITGDSSCTVDMSPVAGAGGPGEVKEARPSSAPTE